MGEVEDLEERMASVEKKVGNPEVSDELPIGRLLKTVAPRLHAFVVDPYGRIFGGWRYPKEEETETSLRHEIVLADEPTSPIHTTVGVPVKVKVKPEIAVEF